MNFSYNIRANNQLFDNHPQNANPPYFYENEQCLQNFSNMPKPEIDPRLKVILRKNDLIKKIGTIC